MNTLDWKKVEDFIRDRNPSEVSAGLLDDWFWTAATVYENGEWLDRDAPYVTSCWATPGFKAILPNGDVVEVVASRKPTDAEAKAEKERREARRQKAEKILAEYRESRGNYE